MTLAKRELAAQTFAALGLTRVLEAIPHRRLLIVLNYHRIGNSEQTAYDSGVFSATEDEFSAQIAYVKSRFHVANLEEALAMLAGYTRARTCVLVTFDDGYIDNYTLAFPILRSQGVHATFFLPTAFVGTKQLPWWDVIAFIVKQSRKRVIRLKHPEVVEFDLHRQDPRQVVARILELYKRPSIQPKEHFIAELEDICECSRPPGDAERRFLNWDEAREMKQAGMGFGSHTHTHEILSTLSPELQLQELRCSREILESQLQAPINTFAYPVGKKDTYTPETIRMLKIAGYQAAFSFYGGLNFPGKTDHFDIRRQGIGAHSYSRFRLQTSAGAVTGRSWF